MPRHCMFIREAGNITGFGWKSFKSTAVLFRALFRQLNLNRVRGKILRSVLRFGMLLPDSILATEECGNPQRAARSRWERLKSWRRSIMVPTI